MTDKNDEHHVEITVFGKRLPPEAEERIDKALETFRSNHRNPTNLMLHVVGYYAIAKGAARMVTHRRIRGMILVGIGIAILLAGHEIEGTEAFATLKTLGNGRTS